MHLGRSGDKACIWAGVAGPLSESKERGRWEAESSSRHNPSWNPNITDIVAHHSTQGTSLTTFSFCNSFSSPPPFTWSFYKRYDYGDGPTNGPRILPVRPKQHWCYMQGVFTAGSGMADPKHLSIRLGINNSPPPPWDAGGPVYFEDISDESALYWNCLPFDQQG
jgi:hypothetical protein